MRKFEVFNTVEELKHRIDGLRSSGYSNQEFEVITANEPTGTIDDYYDVRIESGDPSLLDKFAAFFTGKDATDRLFDKYDWDDYVKHQAREAVHNDQYVLVVHREGHFEDENNFGIGENVGNEERFTNEGRFRDEEHFDNEGRFGNEERFNNDRRFGNEEEIVYDERTGQPMTMGGVRADAAEKMEDLQHGDPHDLRGREYDESKMVFDERTGQPITPEEEVREGHDLLDENLLEDRDLTRDERDLTFENRDLTQDERDLTYEDRDLTQDERDLTYEDRDITHDDRDLTHEDRDLTHDQRDLTNEEREFPIEDHVDHPEARRATEEAVEERTSVSNAGVFVDDKYLTYADEEDVNLDRDPTRDRTYRDNEEEEFFADNETVDDRNFHDPMGQPRRRDQNPLEDQVLQQGHEPQEYVDREVDREEVGFVDEREVNRDFQHLNDPVDRGDFAENRGDFEDRIDPGSLRDENDRDR